MAAEGIRVGGVDVRVQLQRRAVALRLAGHSYRSIGSELGCSHTWAAVLVRAAAASGRGRRAERVRCSELAAIDAQLRLLVSRRRRLLALGRAS